MNLLSVRLRSLKNISLSYCRRRPVRFFALVFFPLAGVALVYLAMWKGFSFILSLGGLGSIIFARLFFVLFFVIFFMIAISFGILYYTGSFRSKETEFLLTLPIREGKISQFKALEAMFFASWIPIIGLVLFIASYAHINSFGAWLAAAALFYFVPYIIIACFLGYVVCVGALQFVSLKRFFIIFCICGVALAFIFGKRQAPGSQDILYMFSEEILFFKAAKLWCAPFSWVPSGIIALERGLRFKPLVLWMNLFSLSALCILAKHSLSQKTFKGLYFKHSVPRHKKAYTKGFLDRLVKNKLIPHKMSVFLLKDIKLFVREPVLWLQFLIFFGLLFFYFLNLRRFSYHLLDILWKNLIVFLNAFSILCVTAAMAVRFVFPQWSLEGKNYWILKLSPVSLKEIYREKFIFSFLMLFAISVLLVFTSNAMLSIEPLLFFCTILIVFVASFSITAFSLGLGAYFADFGSDHYLRSVETIGGLIALIVDFTYVVLSIFSFALINHFHIIGKIHFIKKYLVIFGATWVFISLLSSFVITYCGYRKLIVKDY